jgi:transposase
MFSKRYGLTLFYLFEFEQNVRNTIYISISRISNQEKKRREIFHFIFNQKLISMKKILKLVAGIDVAQKELVVCLGRISDDFSTELFSHKTFPNTSKGFISLVEWANKQAQKIAVEFVMEATGVYHESLAYFLAGKSLPVSIVLPNKISNYSKTLNVKTVTDKTASEAITQFGLERKLDNWQPPKPVYKMLRQLTRERDQVLQAKTVAKNQLHAEQSEAEPNIRSLERIKLHIAFLDKQEKEIMSEVRKLVTGDEEIKNLSTLLCSITGIGLLTAVIVLAETNGFDLIRNKRQLTSYTGLDVKEKQSGTSVKGKPKISKHGNRYLRKAMHLPALAAIRHDERYKAIFIRLVSKHGIKMKATVAVQRKLLEMTYTIYKSQTVYDKNYLTKKEEEQEMDQQVA